MGTEAMVPFMTRSSILTPPMSIDQEKLVGGFP
jgi:hypothetical protein